jgi:uncharacterized protein (TIGR02646 family)
MRKLNRDSVQEPTCLKNYDWRTQEWENLSSSDKKTIVSALCQMQGERQLQQETGIPYVGVRCAYCECLIHSADDKHIEHFKRKNENKGFPKLTFEWTNLFLSCQSDKHCGHYKDRKNASPYNPDELIKPDIHNPDDFLYFHSSGEVRPRKGIPVTARKRATETIRVFHLDCAFLRTQRKKVVDDYFKSWGDSKESILKYLCSECGPEEREDYIQEELNKRKWTGNHFTVLRHFFEFVTEKNQSPEKQPATSNFSPRIRGKGGKKTQPLSPPQQ